MINWKFWQKPEPIVEVNLEEEERLLRRAALQAQMLSAPCPELVESYLDLSEALLQDPSNEGIKTAAWLWHGIGPEGWDDLPAIKEVKPNGWPLEKLRPDEYPKLVGVSPPSESKKKFGEKSKSAIVEPVVAQHRLYEFPLTGEGRKPLAPRSALYMPAKVALTAAEKVARDLPKLVDGITLKPSLRKKLKLEKESHNNRRVWFDSGGKMHDV